MKPSFFLILAACLLPVVLPAQTVPTDYLQVPGPLLFEKTAYHLVWTSHPTATIYKQEYIATGDDPARYKTMILLDLLLGSVPVKDIVEAKVSELRKLHDLNPIVSYQVRALPTGEFLLDFLLSQAAPDGKSLHIVERNVYRYKQLTGPSGKKGVLLFGISQRSYGADTKPFLASLQRTRADLPPKVEQVKLPVVSIAR
jgi:hypothetical protein